MWVPAQARAQLFNIKRIGQSKGKANHNAELDLKVVKQDSGTSLTILLVWMDQPGRADYIRTRPNFGLGLAKALQALDCPFS